MKFLKNKFLKVLIVILPVAIIAVAVIGGNNPVSNAVNTVMTPAYSALYNVTTPVRKFFDRFANAGEYEKEIEALKSEIITLKVANKTREDYIAENKRLKELLDFKMSRQDFETVSARVVSYEPDSWYDTVMLDKGTSSGINVNDSVITPLGLVGKVTEAGSNWARVSTIINTANSIGVKLSRTGDIGVVSGDPSLAEDRCARLEYLSNDKNLIVGDILLSSGLGGIYPADLAIGKVTEIVSDSAGNMEYAVVEPFVDFSALYEVLTIKYEE